MMAVRAFVETREKKAPLPSTLVSLGQGTIVEPPCVIGKPPPNWAGEDYALVIGDNGRIRAFSTIYAGAVIGNRFQTGHGVTIRERNLMGDDVSIGTNAILEPGNTIGNRVRIHTGCFLELVTVEDDVFIGPRVVFADDPHPPCPKYESCKRGATVRRGASIGANATILPGVVIGEGALVGAGSVVVHDVPAGMVVAGNPAKVVKRVDELVCSSGLMERPYVARMD